MSITHIHGDDFWLKVTGLLYQGSTPATLMGWTMHFVLMDTVSREEVYDITFTTSDANVDYLDGTLTFKALTASQVSALIAGRTYHAWLSFYDPNGERTTLAETKLTLLTGPVTTLPA